MNKLIDTEALDAEIRAVKEKVLRDVERKPLPFSTRTLALIADMIVTTITHLARRARERFERVERRQESSDVLLADLESRLAVLEAREATALPKLRQVG